MLGLCWWSLFALCGVWAQHFLPGVDFLAPGLLVSLQEERGGTTAWLLGAFVLLQEGMGNLFFGFSLLQYGVLVLAFMLGRNLFDSRSVTLVSLLGLLLGGGHFLFTLMIMRLEGMLFPLERVLFESVVQALLVPVCWYLAHTLFPRGMKRDERSV